jgi:hypothetical protein
MFNKKPILAITALSAALLAAPVNPAVSAPAGVSAATSSLAAALSGGTGDVTKVHYRKRAHRHGGRRHWRGHRGSRNQRRGWRRHSDGWWYPLAAFGALAAGAAAANAHDRSQAHYAWCEDRYRSYDRESDTFQPYEGPRKRCNSPYN